MRAERLRQLSPVFRRAVELPPGERAAFLDGACAGDAAARRDVERLIRAHESAGSDGISDIWSQPVEGGEPKKLTDFKADEVFSFDWSRDNKLVISHGTATSDVVLIRNAK